tara:strand:+ start:8232 stop:8615 length:384 start_codon:yes stop_codon:yes gene_type:complete
MKLYTTGQGHWAGTQADARKTKKRAGMDCALHEVPTAKPELLDFLNKHKVSVTTRADNVKVNSVKQVVDTTHEDVGPGSVTNVPKVADVPDREEFIGKTTMLVGNGMSKKIHVYFYAENIGGITDEL